jgi:predicted DsbA family dithiol-disulfide isomerase
MNQHRSSLILVLTILLLCGAGAWISGQLVVQHADLWAAGEAGGGLFARVCRASESLGLDCLAAHQTRWSEFTVPVPWPSWDLSVRVHRTVVPVAFLGLAYFVLLATWFAVVGPPQPPGRGWQRMPLLFGSAGAVVSIFYLAVMVMGRAPACLWCAGAHGINLLTVLTICRMYRRLPAVEAATTPREDLPCTSPSPAVAMLPAWRQAVQAVAFALVLIAGLWFYRHEQLAMGSRLQALLPYKQTVTTLRADPQFLMREYLAQRQEVIPARQDDRPADYQPRLVVFTDFECPACYCSVTRMRRQASAAFGEQLNIEVHHFPLCDRCNDSVSGPGHPNACAAAYAAEAARLQGGVAAFWKMHDLLFEERARLGTAPYRKLAARIGLDAERFGRDSEGDAVRRIVQEDVALARRLGVEGTPAVFLNGRRVRAFGRDNPVFWRAVAEHFSSSGTEQHVAAGVEVSGG